MSIFYRVEINETARPNPKLDPSEDCMINEISREFEKPEEVREYLQERYGNNVSTRKKIYNDTKDGIGIVVGFLKSYWNKDCSHNSKSWWQTDWITIYKMTQQTILLKKI